MPKEGSKCKFENMNRTTEVPFRIYADFETILKPIETIEQNEKESFAEKYQKHIPCGYCFHTVSSLEGKEFFPIQDRAESEEDLIPSDFTRSLIEHVREIHNNLEIKKMIFTEKDKKKYDKAVTCWLCTDFFGMEKNKRKVRDHDHCTGKYRGAAHSICNLKFLKANFTPVFFHHLANYDAHLFINNFGKKDGYISCIPHNEEKYISFTIEIELREYIDSNGEERSVKHQIRFVDSYKFMASSLDSLVKNLSKEKMFQTLRFFQDIDLVLRKGVYPYEWMDSFEKFKKLFLQ